MDEHTLLEMVNGFRQSRIILTAFELGLFTALSGRRSTSVEIAGKLGTDPRATDRLMNALGAMGLLTKEKGIFANSPLAARKLDGNTPEYMANLHHVGNLWDTWTFLTEAVRLGRKSGSVIPGRRGGQDWVTSFIQAMHWRAVEQAKRLSAAIDLRGVNRMIDVGGGSGAFAMAMVQAAESLTAVVFDLPEVTPLTQTYLNQAGLTEKVTTISGDYLKDDLQGPYDLALLSAIIHSNTPKENRNLFHRLFDALNPGGRIVISDFLMDEERIHPPMGAVFALNMLVGTAGGDTFTESEVTDWLTKTGFTGVQRIPEPELAGLLIAHRPTAGND